MPAFLPLLRDLGAGAVSATVGSGSPALPWLSLGAGANEYTQRLRAGGRMPFYVVEIETGKRCVLAMGTHPCPATGYADGARCYQSWATCPTAASRAAFTGSTYTWRFSSSAAPLHEMTAILSSYGASTSSQRGILPMVEKVDHVAAQVDLEAGFTRRGKVGVSMHDAGVLNANASQALPTPPFDLDKSTRNTSTAGFWWLRWLAQWPNFKGMTLRIKQGFASSTFPAADLRTLWVGTVEEITRDGKGAVKITSGDAFEPLSKQIPAGVGSGNTLQADVSRSATSWTVDDAYYFTDPATLGSGYVWAEAETTTGRKELVRISGRNLATDTLTVVRARLGTYAEPIREGATITECLAFGTGDGITEGRPLACIKAILERCGLPAHLYVDTSSFDAAELVIGPVALRRIVRKPTAAMELINEIAQLFQLALFVGDSGRIEAKCNFPAAWGETVRTVTDARNVMTGSGATRSGDKQRVTHVSVKYGHDEDGSGDWPESGGLAVWINGSEYSRHNRGIGLEDIARKDMEGRWIRNDDTDLADWIASTWGVAFGSAPLRFTWNAELRDADYQLGDLVDVTSVDLLDAHGARLTTRAMIVERKPMEAHSFTLTAQTFGFFPTSQGGERIAIVAPAGQADYDSATTAEKAYAYVGAAATDDDNDGVTDTTLTGTDDGYYF